MLNRLTAFFVRYVQKFMPDPFLFALILTLVVVALNYLLIPHVNFTGLVSSWYDGVFGKSNIFTFAMQMVLILVTGATLALSPLIKKGLVWLAGFPKNQVQAAILCFIVGCFASFINWGLGLVIGTLLAKEIAKRLENIDFGYIVASAYMGFIVWSSGFSSSIILANTDPNSSLNIIYKQTNQVVPISYTLFTLYNLVPSILILLVFPIVLKYIAPKQIKKIDPKVLIKEDEEMKAQLEKEALQPKTFATQLENAWILNLVFAFTGFYAFIYILKMEMNINTVILLFFMIGLILHWRPISYITSFMNSAKAAGSLLLQYPFYGGIMALMAYVPHQGVEPLQTELARGLITTANAHTLPFLNFIGSCIISLFIPSGGGHWAIQGPIAVESAVAMGQNTLYYLGKISMSVAFGEGVVNMVQPFWALPVIALANLNIRDIMGYCVTAFVISFLFYGVSLLIF